MLNRVRAIIIKDDKLLTIKRSKQDLVYFVFPGGGVEQGEDLETAMKRVYWSSLLNSFDDIKKLI